MSKDNGGQGGKEMGEFPAEPQEDTQIGVVEATETTQSLADNENRTSFSRQLEEGGGTGNDGEPSGAVTSADIAQDISGVVEENPDRQSIPKNENPSDGVRYSGYSDDPSVDRELFLLESQKDEFKEELAGFGIEVPEDEYGKPYFTKTFVKTLPKKIAHRIIQAAVNNDDLEAGSVGSDSSYGSETEVSKKSQTTEDKKSISTAPPDSVLGLQYTPSGTGFITDGTGEKISNEQIARYLENAFNEGALQKQMEQSHDKDAALLSIIRKERREDEKNTSLKKPESILELKEMALRYIPEVNIRPNKTDPINVFEHKPSGVTNNLIQKPQKGVEFIQLLNPREFLGRVDSFATVATTVERKLSNLTVRGSLLSTHLSDMPSTYSQALVDESSMILMSSNDQVFDISPTSAAQFRENWLANFMTGFTPKNTFVLSIVNLITRRNIELRVNKENTLNEICHFYMQYDDHPEYYVWKDVYGRVLSPQKNLIENGMMGQDEKMEFEGYRKLPVILLHFRDGFENEPPLPTNPINATKNKGEGLCRNY